MPSKLAARTDERDPMNLRDAGRLSARRITSILAGLGIVSAGTLGVVIATGATTSSDMTSSTTSTSGTTSSSSTGSTSVSAGTGSSSNATSTGS